MSMRPDLGSIVVKVPKPHEFHMLIDFQQPDKKAVEIAGTTVQMYYPKTNEVQIYNFGKGHKAEVEQFLRLGFGSTSKELRDAYTVTYGGPETVAGEKATRIVLVPKSADLRPSSPNSSSGFPTLPEFRSSRRSTSRAATTASPPIPT